MNKILNLIRTFGHALESYSYKINKQVSYGFAVAFGLGTEL